MKIGVFISPLKHSTILVFDKQQIYGIVVDRAMNTQELNRSKYLCPEDRDYLYTMPIADGPDDFTNILVCNCGYSTDDISTFKTPRPLKFAPWHYKECDDSRDCICDKLDEEAN